MVERASKEAFRVCYSDDERFRLLCRARSRLDGNREAMKFGARGKENLSHRYHPDEEAGYRVDLVSDATWTADIERDRGEKKQALDQIVQNVNILLLLLRQPFSHCH